MVGMAMTPMLVLVFALPVTVLLILSMIRNRRK